MLSSVSRLRDVNDRRIWVAMVAVVLAIWLVGAAVTKYSLEQMAYVTPIAVLVVGATVGLVLLWVKVVLDSLRRRRGEHEEV
jgi:ATP/ADP translocase